MKKINLEWLTVDYLYGTHDALMRRAKLVPWTDDDLTDDVDFQQEEPNEHYFNVILRCCF